MSTRSPLRRAALAAVALLAALVLATPAAAYIIVMKDGSTLTAAKEYEVRGEMAIITLPSGAVTQIELEKIDQEKTKETNARGYGDAQLVDDGTTRQVKKAPDEEERRRQDLSTLARRESALERPEPRRRAEREEVRTAPRTSAGFTDLSRITRQPFNDLTGVPPERYTPPASLPVRASGLSRCHAPASASAPSIATDQPI
jgi:hypothetical protein